MAAEEGGGDWRVDGRVGVYVYVWRAWTGRSDVRGRAVGLALCAGRGDARLFFPDLSAAGVVLRVDVRALRALGVVGFVGVHRTSTRGRDVSEEWA